MSLVTLITIEELKTLRSNWMDQGHRVAFVPTMGALHDGHLSLVEKAKSSGDRVIVSIFVNPAQFGPMEDFSKYPRTLESDIGLLKKLEVDAVFIPNTMDIYPRDFQTYVYNNELSDILCGASRKGHFQGVLTVVLKLFNLVKPHVVLFGKKDYQQCRLIERMISDLNLDVEMILSETVREKNGLAMSSRNKYLTEEQKNCASTIYRSLKAAKVKWDMGERSTDKLIEAFMETISSAHEIKVEYVEIRSRKGLSLFENIINEDCVILTAARLEQIRLIDNLELEQKK
ncbi:MAG: pantoate--beta-alanine ligase [Oligoflexales bacterium]|nr:pantoate--beta-alanine ligase [Oligoflexales bacterium]